LRDCSVEWSVSEFLVHVVDGSSRLIFQDNAVGLDNVQVLFEDFVDGQDATLRSLDLVQLSHVVPLQSKSKISVNFTDISLEPFFCSYETSNLSHSLLKMFPFSIRLKPLQFEIENSKIWS